MTKRESVEDIAVPLQGKPSSDSTLATLRSLYSRAARAFLHRDIILTESLLSTAFALLPPPSSLPDPLSSHRRKFDILRITLESTLYPSQPTNPSHAFLTSLYQRSLELFTPLTFSKGPSPAFLPSQILVTLVLGSLKLDCAEVGRAMIEDWLAKRGQIENDVDEEGNEGYEKVIEMFICHVLPRLEQWDYAKEFLKYETELSFAKRENLRMSLSKIHAQSSQAPIIPLVQPSPTQPQRRSATSTSSPSPPRTPSPSSSVSSSSLSTTSTHTVLPRASKTARSSSPSSVTSEKTVTRQKRHNGDARHRSPIGNDRMSRSPRSHPLEPAMFSGFSTPPSTVTLIKTYLSHYIASSRLSATTFILLFVILPFVSVLLRMRRRRLQITPSPSNVDVVRRRLANVHGSGSVVGSLWSEVIRALVDTIRMAYGGLV